MQEDEVVFIYDENAKDIESKIIEVFKKYLEAKNS